MQKILKKFKNKKIIITGHTGFKGSWLSLWLHLCGAKVMGLSNEVLTEPSHFKSIRLNKKIITLCKNLVQFLCFLTKHTKPLDHLLYSDDTQVLF